MALHVSALVAVPLAPTALAAQRWQVTRSPSSIVTGVTTDVTITVKNVGGGGNSDDVGCVTIDVPAAFVIGGAWIDSVTGGKQWSTQISGTTVSANANGGGDRLKGGTTRDELQIALTVTNDTDGSYTWIADAYANTNCSSKFATETKYLSMSVSSSGSSSNAAPTATADMISIVHGSVASDPAPGLLANDIDPDGDAIVAVKDTDPAHGTLVLNADGSYVYTPAAGYVGLDSFTYHASDGLLTSNSVTVTIDVTNTTPTGLADSYGTPHDTLLVVPADTGVLANDGDADGDAITAVLDTPPSHGTLVTFPSDGSLSYLPDLLYVGSDTFTYRLSDGYTTSAPITVTLNSTNHAPVAVDDAAATLHDAALSVPAGTGVLANDTDGDGDALTAVLVSDVSHGTLALAADGSWSYTPDPGYVGPDAFTYAASDGIAASAAATVTIDVTDADPTAADDTYAVLHDTPLVKGPAGGVLANDADTDGDALTAQLLTGPSHGTLSLDPDGAFTYTPDAWFAGSDSFTYRAIAGPGASSSATVTISVTNAAPAPLPDAYAVHAAGSLAVDAAAGVLANDTDADGDAIHAMLVSGPAHGTLSLMPDGSFSYSPSGGWIGTDTFTYAATDGIAVSAATTVSLDVTDTAPVAGGDAWSVVHDRTLVVGGASGVLGNDSDSDGDPLSAVLDAGPGSGSLTLDADGGFVYTPDAGFTGTDTFTYRASDGILLSAPATVTITVTNIAPLTTADGYSVAHDRTLVVPAAGVLSNDGDADGDALTAALHTAPSRGALTLAPDGSFSYIPDAGFAGADSFMYTATDGIEATTGIVSITVRNVAPIAGDDAWSTPHGVELSVSPAGVLADDTDGDGDALAAILVTGPALGVLALHADGSFTYRPNAGAAGVDTFTYRASDGLATSGPATVTITIAPPPPATPSATPEPTPEPTAYPSPTPDPSPSSEPLPSNEPSSPPATTPEPTVGPGATDRFAIPGTSDGSGPEDGGVTFEGAMIALALDGFDWQIPGLLFSVPGLLVVIAVTLQVASGAAWLPVVRRTLGSRGDRRRRPAGAP